MLDMVGVTLGGLPPFFYSVAKWRSRHFSHKMNSVFSYRSQKSPPGTISINCLDLVFGRIVSLSTGRWESTGLIILILYLCVSEGNPSLWHTMGKIQDHMNVYHCQFLTGYGMLKVLSGPHYILPSMSYSITSES